MILNGSSCILAVLLRVERRTSRKGKHIGHCDCKHPNTFFLTQQFELEVVPFHSIRSWQLIRITQPDNY